MSKNGPLSYDKVEEMDNYRNERIEDTRLSQPPPAYSTKKLLRGWKAMRYLVYVEMIAGIIALIFGITCIATAHSTSDKQHKRYCIDGSGIWTGLLCIATSLIGIKGLAVPTGRNCLLISHLIMSMVSSVSCGLLLIFSCIWTSAASAEHKSNSTGFNMAMLIFNIILIIVAIVHGILGIISASLICYNYGCCKQKPQTIPTSMTNFN